MKWHMPEATLFSGCSVSKAGGEFIDEFHSNAPLTSEAHDRQDIQIMQGQLMQQPRSQLLIQTA